jgi:hypothetical protein
MKFHLPKDFNNYASHQENVTFSQEYDRRSSASNSVNDLLPHVLTANCTAFSANSVFFFDSWHGNSFSFTWIMTYVEFKNNYYKV